MTHVLIRAAATAPIATGDPTQAFVLQLVFLGLGVLLAAVLIYANARSADGIGCLGIIGIALAIFLIIGGVAGPASAIGWWNSL